MRSSLSHLTIDTRGIPQSYPSQHGAVLIAIQFDDDSFVLKQARIPEKDELQDLIILANRRGNPLAHDSRPKNMKWFSVELPKTRRAKLAIHR
jgi:hypothetical protein